MSFAGVLLVSWFFLGAKYRAGHFAGAAICVAAIILLIVTDEEYSNSSRPRNVILGDALVLFGASLYAVSNVLQEKLLGSMLRLLLEADRFLQLMFHGPGLLSS